MLEVFFASVMYWGFLLIIFLWLERRLMQLSERLSDLEGTKDKSKWESESK
jgi:hypothetical protein